SGKGNAIVMMESLMMIISQMGLAKNSEQVNRNKILNNATILGLEQKNKEMEKLIKKIHSEHHGLFGWLEDLVESIAKVFERLFDCVEDLATGNFDKLGKDFMKLTGLKEIFAALEDIAKGIESGNWSEIGKGLEDLAADLLVSLVFGPEVLDTKFGKDMTQTVKLAIDTVVAIIGSLALLFAAAGEKMGNSHADVSKILGKAGDLWKKVAENPQLQAVLQVVMVVMIVAAVVSQQYWLAGLMLVMFALSTSGVLEKATSALAEALGKIPGLSKDAAKIIADVLVIVIVTALSLGAGSIGAVGETAANEVSELTDEMEIEMENFVANTTDTTEEIANQTTEQVENAPGKKNVLNRVGNAIGRRAGATLTGFGSALGSTSLGEDIANVALKKNKKEWEMILEIIQGIIAAVASLGGGLGISASDTVSTADQAIQRGLGKILPKLAQYMEDNAAAMMEASLKLQGGGMGIGGMASAEVGGSQVVQGEIMKKLREMQSDMTLFEATSNETESQNNYLSGRYKILMKEMENIVKEVNQAVTAPIQGEIRALMGQV
ncbi:MAG: hypothetical protein KDK60_01795, partial [Chlamydiia bacterium]|nr:hypothetical protein [Chlamydiia bacterium]